VPLLLVQLLVGPQLGIGALAVIKKLALRFFHAIGNPFPDCAACPFADDDAAFEAPIDPGDRVLDEGDSGEHQRNLLAPLGILLHQAEDVMFVDPHPANVDPDCPQIALGLHQLRIFRAKLPAFLPHPRDPGLTSLLAHPEEILEREVAIDVA